MQYPPLQVTRQGEDLCEAISREPLAGRSDETRRGQGQRCDGDEPIRAAPARGSGDGSKTRNLASDQTSYITATNLVVDAGGHVV